MSPNEEPRSTRLPSEPTNWIVSEELRRLAHAIHSLGGLDPEEVNRSIGHIEANNVHGQAPYPISLLGETLNSLSLGIEAVGDARRKFLAARTENRRPPLPTEPQQIRLDAITVATKLSKVDYDMQNRGVSYAELLNQYRQEGVNWEDIVASHNRQQAALQTLRNLLPDARFIPRDEISGAELQSSDLVIAFGGDDHFKHVSHSISSGFILGVNSDPLTSVGALTSTTVDGLPDLLTLLESGDFLVEEWSRLEISVNGKALPHACSEIFIGEENSTLTTRARGNIGDKTFFIKGSGLLVSTGAGSTGWFRAASQHLFHGEHLWLRTDRHGEFVCREPYGDVDSLNHATLHGRLDPGQKFEIISSSNHRPIVSVDSLVTEHFPRGQRAVIQISPSPLKVVVPRPLHAPAAQ